MNTFEEANIGGGNQGQGQAQPGDMTTDDLVLMIGEGAIRERQQQKIRQYFERQLGAMQQEMLRAQSLAVAQAEQEKSQAVASLQTRVVDLEKQVHETALERDEAIKKMKEAKSPAVSGKKVIKMSEKTTGGGAAVERDGHEQR
jgi:hypothetical protein